MKSLLPAVLLNCIISCTIWSGAQVQAAMPDKPFTAVYENITDFGKCTRKVVWDGHGHARVETTSPSGVRVGFVDAPNHSMTLCTSSGQAMNIVLRDQDLEDMGIDLSKKITGRTSLGTKLIDGHLCQGQRYSLGEFTTEAWLDPQINCNRLTITTHPSIGRSTTRLTIFSSAPPDPRDFVIPTASKIRARQTN